MNLKCKNTVGCKTLTKNKIYNIHAVLIKNKLSGMYLNTTGFDEYADLIVLKNDNGRMISCSAKRFEYV